MLAARKTAGVAAQTHGHYLKGTVFCGGCGSRLLVTHAKNRHGVTYPYFVCAGRHAKRTDCTRPAILIETVEQMVEDLYRHLQPTPGARAALEPMLDWQIDQHLTTRTAAAKELTATRAQLEHERARLMQAYYADAVPLDLLKREHDRIDTALNDIDIRLEQQRRGAGQLRHALGLALDVLDSVTDAYLEGDAAVRRACNQALFTQILVDPDQLRPGYHQPYRLLLHRKVAAMARTRAS